MGTSPINIAPQIAQTPQAQPAQAPQMDIVKLLQDPEFNKFSPSEQRTALSKYYPHYGQMSDQAYLDLRNKAGVPYGAATEANASADRPLRDRVLDFGRPIADAAFGTAVGGAAAATGVGSVLAPAAGLASGTALDMLLQRLYSKPPTSTLSEAIGAEPGSVKSSLANAGENIATNELGGMVMKPLVRGAKSLASEFYNPGSVVGDIYKLNPTYSQYAQNTFGKSSPSKWIEDTFANGAKTEALQKASQAGTVDIQKAAAKYAGRAPSTVANPENMAYFIKSGAEKNLTDSFAASDAQANTAKLIANSNAVPIKRSGLNQLTQLTNPMPNQTSIAGPINMNSTIQTAQSYLLKQQQLYGHTLANVPEEEKPLVAAAKNILDSSGAQFNSQGTLTKADPISFEDAWNFKKTADRFGQKIPLFKQFARSINDDVDTSIPQWKNNPKQALEAWKGAKATVAQRLNTFGDDGVKQMIETTNSPMKDVDAIINDPEKLNRALSAGNLKLPNGTVASSNMKGDLKAYTLMKMLQGSTETDPINQGVSKLNMQKLMDQWNDPKFSNAKNALFSKNEQSDLGSTLQNIAKVNTPIRGNAGLASTKALITTAGATLPFAVMSGHITPYEAGAAGITGIKLSGMAVGKLLTNPKSARLMQALINGQPTGVSSDALSKTLAGALNGSMITLTSPDGREQTGRLKGGKLVQE